MSDLTVSIVINALDKFSAPAQKIAGASEKMAARLEESQKALQGLDSRGKAVQRLKALEAGLGKSAAEMDKARKRTAALGRELAHTVNPSKKLKREFDDARRKSGELAKSHRRQKEQLRLLRGELRSAGIDTRKLGESMRKIAGDLEAANTKMSKMRQISDRVAASRARYDRNLQRAANVSLVAGGLDRVGRGALNMVSDPIAKMRLVERSRGELASLGIEKAGLDQITNRGRELSTKLAGVTSSAFISAAYDIKSGIASLSDAGVADMTEMAALTAKATKADVGQMTSLFATGHGSFKESLYAGVSDQAFGQVFSASLAKSVQMFKTDGGKMQQAIQSMGSGLAESGISLADQFTALGMLQQKMEAGMSGTTLNAVERSAAQAQARFEKMGIAIQTLDENGNLRQLPDLLADMQQEFGEAYSTETGAKIQQAFGSEEAVKFFKALWGQQDAFRENSKALKEAQTQGDAFTRAMAANMDKNMDARLQVLQQRWDNIKEKIGTALIPALEALVPLLEKGAALVGRFTGGNEKVTAALVGIVGGIGLLATVMAPVITAIASLTATIAFLGHMSRKTTGAMAMGALAGGGGRGRGLRGLAGKAGGLLKGKLGLVGAGIGAISIGSTLLDDSLSGSEKAASVAQDAGGIGGALAGAAAGAALGSVVPVVGTAIGGLIGGIVGGMGGDWLGSKVGSLFTNGEPMDTLSDSISKAADPTTKTPLAAPTTLSPPTAPLPVSAANSVQHNDHSRHEHSYSITVQQQPGEDSSLLADRLMREIEKRQQRMDREALGDAF